MIKLGSSNSRVSGGRKVLGIKEIAGCGGEVPDEREVPVEAPGEAPIEVPGEVPGGEREVSGEREVPGAGLPFTCLMGDILSLSGSGSGRSVISTSPSLSLLSSLVFGFPGLSGAFCLESILTTIKMF